ncbi:MAG: S1 RNA-binding domain-containing protein [Anaerolineales bacterium]
MATEAVATTESTSVTDIQNLKRKMKVSGTVMKTTLAGAVVDIGLSTPGVIHISQLQAEATNRVEDVVRPGQTVEVWVKRVDPKKNRIELTMIPPLDLEWREIEKGMVVKGKVTRLEKFGAFVDIGAERPGLVHISEMTHGYIKTPGEVVSEGDKIEVKVLDVNRRKKQIKLSMKALEEKPTPAPRSSQSRKDKEKEAPAEAEKEEPVPTAMEMALREAMERTRSQDSTPKAKSRRKSSQNEDEMGEILNRTLESKARSSE